MRTQEEIRDKYFKFLEQNPKSWVYNSKDEKLIAWFQGYDEAMKYVLGVDK